MPRPRVYQTLAEKKALGYLQDVVSDSDLLTPVARKQVLTALSALMEAVALVTTKAA